MSGGGKSGGGDPAGRAMRALERGATTLGAQVARSVRGRWRRMPAARRGKLESLAANVREQARDPREAAEQAAARPEVSEIEVRDLRAELARELDRLASADIAASRGSGQLAGETPSADGQA
jgi:hypothetical protein